MESQPDRILVVDDETHVRNLIVQVLTRSGFEVEAAENGAVALALFTQTAPFNLVLSDIRMPVMDGPQLAHHLRQLDPTLPIVFTSGYADDWAGGGAAEQEFPLLYKPFTLTELVRVARENLRHG